MPGSWLQMTKWTHQSAPPVSKQSSQKAKLIVWETTYSSENALRGHSRRTQILIATFVAIVGNSFIALIDGILLVEAIGAGDAAVPAEVEHVGGHGLAVSDTSFAIVMDRAVVHADRVVKVEVGRADPLAG
jgi:hypothetical protein